MKTAVAILVVLGLSVGPQFTACVPVAHAASASSAARKEATTLNKDALRLYGQKKYAQAAVKFERAYLLVPAANVLYNLARALHRSGDTKQAKPFYVELVLKFPKFNAKKRANAYRYIKEIEALEASAASVQARKAKAAEQQAKANEWQQQGLELKVRGKYEAAAEVFIRAHREQPGHLWLWQAAQALEAGKKLQDARGWYNVLVSLEGAPADVVAKARGRIKAIDAGMANATNWVANGPDRRGNVEQALLKQRYIQVRDDARGLRTAGIGTMVVGGLAALAGGVLFTVAETKRGEVRKVIDDAGPGGTVTTMTQDAAARAEAEANTLGTAGVVSLAVGGLALASGLTMFIIGSGNVEDAERDLLRLGASPTRGGASFLVGGRF